jgi:hypothetical protein
MGGGNSGGRAGWRSETGSLPKIQGVNASAAGFRRRHRTVAEPGDHGTVIPGQIRSLGRRVLLDQST